MQQSTIHSSPTAAGHGTTVAQISQREMKKVCLIGVWIAQYALGAAAIYTMAKGDLMISIPLLAASYYSTVLGARLIGIGDDMQRDAHASVPRLVNTLWTLTCFFLMVVFASTMLGMQTIGGFYIPINGTQALIIFYASAALRDLFLAKFYFAQHL